MACTQHVGYASPLEATKSERENLMYVTCVAPRYQLSGEHDRLVTIDLNPKSDAYSKVIHQLIVPHKGDELHHFGWNACSSSKCSGVKRNRLIVPGLNSDRLYIIDVDNAREPKLMKVIPPELLHEKYNVSGPHTVHCLPSGDVMVNFLGDRNGKEKGTFLLLEQGTFDVKGPWIKDDERIPLNYDFWYQPRHNILVSTEFAAPEIFRKGFFLTDQQIGLYGKQLNLWNFKEGKYIQSLDLASKGGHIPLEIRFLHNPEMPIGFVGCAYSSAIFRIFKENEKWEAEKVIQVPALMVSNWLLPVMPAMITDILISMDDRFLFFSNWFHGDIRQYDISDTKQPKLVGQINVGGSLTNDLQIDILGSYVEGKEKPQKIPEGACVLINRVRPKIHDIPLRGGPQMIQLSLDGKRLYVTNSLLSPWDEQFYKENITKGSVMYLIDVDNEVGGLTLNKDFIVDFGNIGGGPFIAHEMRFPGGDCTSDIWT